ncbi:RnfH family protein [Beggiatoa leptomitoformis]|uniref:UPF0125 protein BLE401_01345 n=1 Tax=Beggiatoa leptomitoformis TaxID=288004 RepID=A0A2N9YAI6_9GAMM|nr:RnfH family protein [Beggiatoa leptomitoformis]ALG67130.1 RnfH family protein [Beggiatoa leptomitoformis]AUI67471.1 RnfH family protein [Beggiatoa leptomitoformis]
MDTLIHIEVAYAKQAEQAIIPLTVPNNTTAEQAIELSNIKTRFQEIDLTQQKIGIFSKICALDTVLQEGDRVEIYRPLIADPKLVRKQRADEGKKMKKGGGDI